MSKPRYKWWGYVKAVIRAYPDHRRDICAIKQQSITPRYGGSSGGGGDGRPVERLALRALPPDEQRELDAVEAAERIVAAMPDGAERLRLIELVFWRRSHTLQGAASELYISYATAKRWHNRFIVLVAKKMELIER